VDDDLKEYDLDHYDDDETKEAERNEGVPMGMFAGIKSLAYHESNAEDPYITLQDDEEDEEEREELQILSTDNLILAARIEDEVAHLEVYVYEDDSDNLYVHHDIMLPAIPLSVEWLDFPVNKPGSGSEQTGNFVAVGTMDPDIELWDLDIVDCMYPNAVLGQGTETAAEGDRTKRKKKKKKSKKANDDYHVDAVLSLAANRQHRNFLASSSADSTIKLWDLNTTKCVKSYSYHTDKVCSVAWNPKQATALLSGSYDRTVVAADVRDTKAPTSRWGVESDVESIRWDPHDSNYFYVSTTPVNTTYTKVPQGINRKWHNPLPRRAQSALGPRKNKTNLDTPSARRICLFVRCKPHYPRFPGDRLHGQGSQTMEHPSQRPQHGSVPQPRSRQSLRHNLCAGQ